ncbi:hypothetical protein A7982_12981 [Minicystis rosea]|nr:hypothetical protein A7982_12981 [Minicystis rosea]
MIGGGGGGAAPTTSGPTSSVSSSISSSSSSPSGPSSSSGVFPGCANPTPVGLPAAPCTPTNAVCGSESSVCVATAHAHGAPAFDLRVSHVTLSAPKAFTKGVVQNVFETATRLNRPLCNLSGGGSFNWLLHFDTNAGTLTIGGAKGVPDPTAGYSLIDETVLLGEGTFWVKPTTVSATLDPSCGLETSAGDVLLPFFSGVGDNSFTLFPLRSLRFFDTTITPDHDCVGAYNASGLETFNNCAPDPVNPDFLDGGHFQAFITLEDADAVLVSVLSETLCVLLSEDPTTFGTGSQPVKCKRGANNQIVLQGDWCSATNQPASPGCADAMRFEGTFAASGVKIQ